MSARSCAVCSVEEEPRGPLPQVIASRVEALRQERLRAFVDQAQKPGAPSERTGLESQVDDLLDSLYNLHRLEQLAAHAAHGGQITVEADRLLVSAHAETYLQLLEKYAAESPGVVAPSLLLTTYPRPLD